MDSEFIKTLLAEKFEPVHLEVVDQSMQHAGHQAGMNGRGTHFKICIVSQYFRAQSRLDRHRSVLHVLKPGMENDGVHAVALQVFDPEEWKLRPGKRGCYDR